MLPFELSFNIILIAFIAIILVFYIILIVKLKPSKETKLPSNIPFEREKEPPIKPKRQEKPMLLPEPEKTADEEPALPVETQISIKPQKSPEEPIMKGESQKGVLSKTPSETDETQEKQKTKKDKEAKKSFFLFGEKNFEGCPHKFGYLSSLPKNTPIPDECFGCPRIIECLRTLKIQ